MMMMMMMMIDISRLSAYADKLVTKNELAKYTPVY